MARIAVIAAIAINLLISGPPAAAVPIPPPLVIGGVKWLANTFIAAAVTEAGKETGRKAVTFVFDKVKGAYYDKEFAKREVTIRHELPQVSAVEKANLQQELKILQSQRRVLKSLLETTPRQDDLVKLQRQVQADLASLTEILDRHEERIGVLESDVEELKHLEDRFSELEARLGELEEITPVIVLQQAERFDRAVNAVDLEISTGLHLQFRVEPEDAFIRTWRRGEERATVNGRAKEYDPRRKGTKTLILPFDGDYLITILHETRPSYRILVHADELSDPKVFNVRLRSGS